MQEKNLIHFGWCFDPRVISFDSAEIKCKPLRLEYKVLSIFFIFDIFIFYIFFTYSFTYYLFITNSMAHETQKLHAIFTGIFQLSLSWMELAQFLVLTHIPLRSILILSSHLRLGLPKGILLVGLPIKFLKTLLPSSILATWPAHLNLLYLITLTALSELYKLWSSSLWSLLIPLWPKYASQDPVFKDP
jgi:hypothetical protein